MAKATAKSRTMAKATPTFRVYDVKIAFRGRVLGGIPSNQDLLRDHLLRQCKKHFGDDAEAAEAEAKEIMENLDEAVEQQINVFRRDSEGTLCLGAYQIKGMIREAGSMLGMTRTRPNRASFRQTVQHGFFPIPPLIRFRRGNEWVAKADGTQEDCGTVVDRSGARSIITVNEYVENAGCEFRLRVVDNGAITDQEMRELLGISRDIGLGAKRPQGCGTFDIVSFEVVDSVPVDDGF
jgi:hypothetical protein